MANMSDRRSQIVDAAARLVAERGFAATSVDDVIRAAQLSGKSHFYHYFRSKEELGFAVLARQWDRFSERGIAVLREPMIAPFERLGLFIDGLIGVQVARDYRGGSPFGNLAAEMADAHDGFRERIAGVFERWEGALVALLEEAKDELADGVQPARLARFVVATLEGGLLVSRVRRDPAALMGVAEDLKRFVATHRRPSGDGASEAHTLRLAARGSPE